MSGVGDISRELMLVDGKEAASVNGEFISVENPARRGSVIAEVPRANASDIDFAVKAAAKAFETWRHIPARERGKLLLKMADAIEAGTEEIARTLSMETGNAIRTQSRAEVKNAAEFIRYFGGVAGELRGDTMPVDQHLLAYTQREPLGVVGGIIPWNSPAALAALKFAPALAAGNTMVLKAAEDAPLAVLKMAKICAPFLPAGVMNIVTGLGQECGAPLATHPLVRKLTFTGSTEVGKSIMHSAADRIVPVSLELGGKSPQIVYPDADNDKVAEGVISGMRFARQGQSCSAGSRLYLHRSIVESFIDKMVSRLKLLKVGDPLQEDTDMGAIINKKQFDSVCSYIEEGMNHPNARLITGGLPPKEGRLAQGYHLEPTVFVCEDNGWRLAKEEIFGPVLVVIPWEDEAELIRMVNDSNYGLAAFIWTKDTTRALRIAGRIESGWIQINRGGGMMIGHAYGGYKQSGIGREYSLASMLDSFTQIKSVMVNLEEQV